METNDTLNASRRSFLSAASATAAAALFVSKNLAAEISESGPEGGASAESTPSLRMDRVDTAVVIIDPQNDVLSEKGLAWPLLHESLKEINTVEKLVEKPLSAHLVQAAMQLGIVHAAVNFSQIGYTRDASRISYDHQEVPVNTLPVCIELLAPKRLLEQFIREQACHLRNTTLVLVDGVHISNLFLAEVEESIDNHRHSVEYIRGIDGDVEVAVECVDADEDEQQVVGD